MSDGEDDKLGMSPSEAENMVTVPSSARAKLRGAFTGKLSW